MKLNNRSKKRPDASFRLLADKIPVPPPNWLRLLPNGMPYPNIVVEVAVNNESPQRLLDDADRYFTLFTSTTIWIGVKVWVKGKFFWVGWGERAAKGTGAIIHTVMDWPPNHHPISTPVNHIYQIPMTIAYGSGIAIPQNQPATLDIDVDVIRRRILQCDL